MKKMIVKVVNGIWLQPPRLIISPVYLDYQIMGAP